MNETGTAMKIAAAAQGAEVDFDEDWYDPEPPKAASAFDIMDMTFGMGYESKD